MVRQRLADFRRANRIVDPSADAAGQMGLLNALQAELAQALVERDVLLSYAERGRPAGAAGQPPHRRHLRAHRGRARLARHRRGHRHPARGGRHLRGAARRPRVRQHRLYPGAGRALRGAGRGAAAVALPGAARGADAGRAARSIPAGRCSPGSSGSSCCSAGASPCSSTTTCATPAEPCLRRPLAHRMRAGIPHGGGHDGSEAGRPAQGHQPQPRAGAGGGGAPARRQPVARRRGRPAPGGPRGGRAPLAGGEPRGLLLRATPMWRSTACRWRSTACSDGLLRYPRAPRAASWSSTCSPT